jgi:hypothetical protein
VVPAGGRWTEVWDPISRELHRALTLVRGSGVVDPKWSYGM